MDKDNLITTTELIVNDFELEPQEEQLTEEQLLQLLANQIAQMIEYRLEFLLSLMYRLDVNEAKVNDALSPHCPEPANIALAKLVLERQKQRAFTKKHYVQNELDDIEDGLKL